MPAAFDYFALVIQQLLGFFAGFIKFSYWFLVLSSQFSVQPQAVTLLVIPARNSRNIHRTLISP